MSEEETRVLIAMDGSKYADYAFECEYTLILTQTPKCRVFQTLKRDVGFETCICYKVPDSSNCPEKALGILRMSTSLGIVSFCTTVPNFILSRSCRWEVGSTEIVARMIEEDRVRAEHYLKHLTEKMKSANVGIQYTQQQNNRALHLLHGKVKQTVGPPRTEIIRVTEEEHVHLIITGTRGLGTVKRTILGSVSDHLLHHSHVPVLVCRHNDDYNSYPKHEYTRALV